MEELHKKLIDIMALLKGIPQIASPKIPKIPQPSAPGVTPVTAAPGTNKNPVNVAQQIKDPSTKITAIKQAKSLVKFDKNGQWTLES